MYNHNLKEWAMNDPTKIIIEHNESDAYAGYWLIFARHKFAFALVFSVCALFGLGVVFSDTAKYTYTSLIEIGTIIGGEEVSPIESMESVAAKLKNAYVPAARRRIAEKLKNETPPDVEIISPSQKSSYVIILRSQGPKEHVAIHRDLHELIFQTLEDNHRQLFDAHSESLSKLLIDVDSKARKFLKDTRKSKDEKQAMLYVEVTGLRRVLVSRSKTRMVSPMTQSLEPIKKNRYQIIVVSILLALVAGVLAVFLIETIARTRRVLGRM